MTLAPGWRTLGACLAPPSHSIFEDQPPPGSTLSWVNQLLPPQGLRCRAHPAPEAQPINQFLPPRTSHKGYDVVHIPHLKPKPFKAGEKLRAIKELPDWAQSAFKVGVGTRV